MGIIIFLILCLVLLRSINKTKEKEKTMGIIYSDHFVTYISGLANIVSGKKVTVCVYKDKIVLRSPADFQSEDDGKIYITININKISSVEIKSCQQIRQEISLGKIVMSGTFPLGMQKNKAVVNNYLVITFADDFGQVRNLILQAKKLQELADNLRSAVYKDRAASAQSTNGEENI